jgi:DNA transformation protein and related proteins
MSATSACDLALEPTARINALGPVTVTHFFGGAGLVADGVQFGFVMKGSLYLRVDDTSRAAFAALGAAPFAYTGRSKAVAVASYYEAPSEVVDDPEQLGRWAGQAHRAAVAARRREPVKSKRRSTGVAL